MSTETHSTYGLLGAVLMTLAPVVVLLRRRCDFPAALVVGGVVAQLLIGAAIGWHPANHRYLVAAMCLTWAGGSVLLAGRCRPGTALGLTVVLASCAVYVPVNAQRSPAKLGVAVRDRDLLLRDADRELIARATRWKQDGEVPVVLTAARAHVFHLFDQLDGDLTSLPDLSEEDLRELDAIHGRGRYRIVVMNRPELKLPGVVREEVIPAAKTAIYTWRPPP